MIGEVRCVMIANPQCKLAMKSTTNHPLYESWMLSHDWKKDTLIHLNEHQVLPIYIYQHSLPFKCTEKEKYSRKIIFLVFKGDYMDRFWHLISPGNESNTNGRCIRNIEATSEYCLCVL